MQSTSFPPAESPSMDVSAYFQISKDISIADSTFRIHATPAPPDAPIFVLIHGGGHTSLSFSLLARLLRQAGAGVLALDMRGHGHTTADARDMHLETLGQDVVHVVEQCVPADTEVVLVGHSLGGAVAVEASKSVRCLLGVVVIDVVEGTAVEALSQMKSIVRARPQSFASEQEAVQWALQSGQTKNKASAELSVPAQLKRMDNGRMTWRTDLLATEPFWESWFKDLSNKFLAVKAARLLILAGTDRLDKALTIGQIQGKYQLVILNQAGHLVHEDCPEETAEVLVKFWKRNSRMNLPPAIRNKVHRVGS